MTWPLDLAPWVTRLSEAGIEGIKTVGLAGDLARLKDVRRAMPGIWLLPATDSVTARSPDAVRTQKRRVTSAVAVVIGMQHYGDATGGKAVDALQPIRKAIADSLRGWRINDQSTPVQFAGGGQAPELEGGAMWWIDQYEVSLYD